jgi:protein-S-isoprenylcysteine O-methyltransferase Ste14
MPTIKWDLNSVCQFVYELALLLSLGVLVLAPFHSSAIKHYNIDRSSGSSTVGFSLSHTSIHVGDFLPVYRFQPDLTSELGHLKVSSIREGEAVASFYPNKQVPLGRHGRVLEVKGNRLKVSLGATASLKTGDRLCVFKDRDLVGKIRLQEVDSDDSWSDIEYIAPNTLLVEGLTVSEYTVVTQAVVLNNSFLFFLEISVFLGLIVLYTYFFFFRRSSLLVLLGEWLRRKFKYVPQIAFKFFIHLMAGVLFIWFVVNFLPLCIDYFSGMLREMINWYFHFSIATPNAYLWLNEHTMALYGLAGAMYLAVFIGKGSSPILLLWKAMSYKTNEDPINRSWGGDLVIWSLHLVIFYAFGRTLLIFLHGNLNGAIHLMWPGYSFSWHQWTSLFHLPAPSSLTFEEFCLVMRYLLWSITVIGCLLGYCYSIFGYLFGKRIRNLDFTVMGWLTNAVCYGPLLGGIIWQMTPSLTGQEPTVVQGPLWYFMLSTELLLNVLYTITIWNLGTMFGVMTDKGVRTSGFYRVTRHPSYTLESLMFVMIFLNGVSTYQQWLAVSMFILTYYVRSEREDQFMTASNPQYKSYQEQTPYKFIPGIY